MNPPSKQFAFASTQATSEEVEVETMDVVDHQQAMQSSLACTHLLLHHFKSIQSSSYGGHFYSSSTKPKVEMYKPFYEKSLKVFFDFFNQPGVLPITMREKIIKELLSSERIGQEMITAMSEELDAIQDRRNMETWPRERFFPNLPSINKDYQLSLEDLLEHVGVGLERIMFLSHIQFQACEEVFSNPTPSPTFSPSKPR